MQAPRSPDPSGDASVNAFVVGAIGSPRSGNTASFAGGVGGGVLMVGPSHRNPGPNGLIASVCSDFAPRITRTSRRLSNASSAIDASTAAP